LLYAQIPEIFDEYAAFGDLTWRMTDAFSVSGGLRYAKNHQDFNIYLAGAVIGPASSTHIGTQEGVLTWMGTAEYHFSKDIMLYARGASGYRPGGPNVPTAGAPLTFDADRLTNSELGLKSTFLDGRAQVNLDVYHIDWKNIQLLVYANNISYFANGGNAVSNGLELASQYSPVHGLTLGLNAAYTDSHLTSLVPGANYLLTGFQLPGVPKGSASITADYEWDLYHQWKASIGGAYRYVGSQWLSLVESSSTGNSSPTVRAPGYSFFDLHASVRSDRLTLRLYARNLTNKAAITGGANSGLVVTNNATGDSQVNAAFLEPRTVGLGVDYSF
jgi:outer membrane receptor protein involved in Fe transport